jgi:hypothetical protein
MQTNNHTPGPWTSVYRDTKRVTEIMAGDIRIGFTTTEPEANAAFIVTACNNYEALLAALQKVAGEYSTKDLYAARDLLSSLGSPVVLS